LADGKAFRGRLAVDIAFDVKQRVDPANRFQRHR
jgi:hypothetical protein